VAEAWAPTLADVGRHIPTRTRDTRTPGSDTMLGTFTPATTPTIDQAQSVIDDAVNWVLATAGPMPPQASTAYDMVSQAARTAAAWRAAADIEVAYPNRDADIRVAAQLDVRAKDALAALLRAMVETETGVVEPVPVWQSPAPPPWADIDPGAGTEAIYGQMGWG
jgi:hypothetical protein